MATTMCAPPMVPSITSEEQHYARSPHAPGIARRFVRAQLMAWGLDPLIDSTELVTSELVTNAVLYGGGEEITVRVTMSGGAVCVRVRDLSSDLPREQSAAGDDESGRGLAIVAGLAPEWGVYRLAAGGKVTWATIAGAK